MDYDGCTVVRGASRRTSLKLRMLDKDVECQTRRRVCYYCPYGGLVIAVDCQRRLIANLIRLGSGMFYRLLTRLKAVLGISPVNKVLPQIEELLIAEIPRVVKAARISDPVYCLRIWYNGTDSMSDAVPYCMLIKESARKTYIATHGLRDVGALWMADEWTYPEMHFDIHSNHPKLKQLYAEWYEWLCSQDDETEALQLFRKMTQRVARRLNDLDWRKILPVTDDFVVFPADGAHAFWDDTGDLLASITPAQQALLETRKLLPR